MALGGSVLAQLGTRARRHRSFGQVTVVSMRASVDGMSSKRVLSIDVDFFVEPTAYDMSMSSTERLPPDYEVDELREVEKFLREQCCLDDGRRTPGYFIVNHDEAFDVLQKLARDHGPVELIHVDAHADIGNGDAGYMYLLFDWLRRPEPRPSPRRGPAELNLANWLAFAAAGGLVESAQFVPRRFPPNDLLIFYIDGYGTDTTKLEFRELEEEDVRAILPLDPFRERVASRTLIRTVPWRNTKRDAFALQSPPDFVIVCQSPQFTPAAADAVVDLLRRFVVEDDAG